MAVGQAKAKGNASGAHDDRGRRHVTAVVKRGRRRRRRRRRRRKAENRVTGSWRSFHHALPLLFNLMTKKADTLISGASPEATSTAEDKKNVERMMRLPTSQPPLFVAASDEHMFTHTRTSTHTYVHTNGTSRAERRYNGLASFPSAFRQPSLFQPSFIIVRPPFHPFSTTHTLRPALSFLSLLRANTRTHINTHTHIRDIVLLNASKRQQ